MAARIARFEILYNRWMEGATTEGSAGSTRRVKRVDGSGTLVVSGVVINVRKGKGDAVWFETPNGEPIELVNPRGAAEVG